MGGRRYTHRGAGAAALLPLLVAAAVATVAAADAPLGAPALMQEVTTYSGLGMRGHLTGSPQEERTLAWMLAGLQASGAQTGVDGVSFYAFEPRAWSLEIGDRRISALTPYFYSGDTGPAPVTAPLVYAGEGTPADLARTDVKGKIAVVYVPYLEDFLDPTFTGQGPVTGAFSSIESAGAVGLVAVTDGPRNYPVNQDVSSLLGTQRLPTLFVGKRTGRAGDSRSARRHLCEPAPRRRSSSRVHAEPLGGHTGSRQLALRRDRNAQLGV